MTDTIPLQHDDGPGVAQEASALRIALGFFIVPLLVVVAAVAVFVLFGLIAHEDKPAGEYLAEITGRGINEPWQAAFHLAQKLQLDEDLQGDAGLARRIERALQHPNARDEQVRKFLVLALGRIGHPASVDALVPYVEDAAPDVRFNALWSLGNIGPPAASVAAGVIAGRLRDEDPGVRTMAAYVLGLLAEPASRGPLAVALNDPLPQVRWNAAVALAKLDDDAGLQVLREMIDRDYLETVEGLTHRQEQTAMVAAIQALAHLRAPGTREELERLRTGDPDLRVREAAREALVGIEELYR